jgi:uncharacterized protein YidB (DUF937 family)
VPAVVAQEVDVAQPVEPVVVVDHDGIIGAGAEAEKTVEDAPDPGHVGLDLGLAQQLPAVVLARGVADLGGAAAHQHDRLVARALQPVQQHDGKQRADVERIGGAVESDIGGHGRLAHQRVEAVQIRTLMDEAAIADLAQEFGLEKTVVPGAAGDRMW